MGSSLRRVRGQINRKIFLFKNRRHKVRLFPIVLGAQKAKSGGSLEAGIQSHLSNRIRTCLKNKKK
jgi:hypothetical protein